MTKKVECVESGKEEPRPAAVIARWNRKTEWLYLISPEIRAGMLPKAIVTGHLSRIEAPGRCAIHLLDTVPPGPFVKTFEIDAAGYVWECLDKPAHDNGVAQNATGE